MPEKEGMPISYHIYNSRLYWDANDILAVAIDYINKKQDLSTFLSDMSATAIAMRKDWKEKHH